MLCTLGGATDGDCAVRGVQCRARSAAGRRQRAAARPAAYKGGMLLPSTLAQPCPAAVPACVEQAVPCHRCRHMTLKEGCSRDGRQGLVLDVGANVSG